MPVAVVDVPMIGILPLVRDRSHGEHFVGQRRSDDRNHLVAADQLARGVDRLILVCGAILDRQHDLAPAQNALRVDLAERQFHSRLDGGAIGRVGAGQDLDRAELHWLLRVSDAGREQQASQSGAKMPTQHNRRVPRVRIARDLVQRVTESRVDPVPITPCAPLAATALPPDDRPAHRHLEHQLAPPPPPFAREIGRGRSTRT